MAKDRTHSERRGRSAGRRALGLSPLVLVVEDHTLISVLMRDTLQSYGYRVMTAADAREGIRLATALRPDIILMDICLPVMSGLEATSILKSKPALRHIPVVAVTAHAMSGDQERMLSGGCQAYLSKPFRMAELLRVVREVLAERRRGGIAARVARRLPQAS